MASTRPSRTSRHTFTARIEAIAMGVPYYAVVLPAGVSAALGRGRVHVAGTVGGAPLQTSLLPVKSGGHKLLLSRRVREAAGVGPGDRVKVVLERAEAPREDPMPDDLVHALREADALGAFGRIARSTRNEVIRWIEDAKTEATRGKRIQRAVERGLAAREREVDREGTR